MRCFGCAYYLVWPHLVVLSISLRDIKNILDASIFPPVQATCLSQDISIHICQVHRSECSCCVNSQGPDPLLSSLELSFLGD